ncbi:MAG: ankyrin repeat domain-containing protein [Alphaproteobacteria bacterium]|nr:ankyrin repeat domain-containing protein [Alphaproteobacteria bacterium]
MSKDIDKVTQEFHRYVNPREIDIKGCRQFLKKGADVNVPVWHENKQSMTPLMCAAALQSKEAAQLFLDYAADVDARSDIQCTALIIAAQQNCVGIVEMLLDKGVDVDARDKNGLTAVAWSAFLGYCDMTGLLLKHGASVEGEFTIAQGTGPLIDVANRGMNPAVVKVITDSIGQRFKDAAAKGTLKKRRILRPSHAMPK